MTQHIHPDIQAECIERYELKHTPGPWRIYQGGIHPELGSGKFPNAEHAIAGEFYGPDAAANRRLVAAAPDLLAALEDFQAESRVVEHNTSLNIAIENAREAIKLATGVMP